MGEHHVDERPCFHPPVRARSVSAITSSTSQLSHNRTPTIAYCLTGKPRATLWTTSHTNTSSIAPTSSPGAVL
jgi:protein tyrosine phosphatase (PTP) superfamily phosphohydrolase (DUF442 family)